MTTELDLALQERLERSPAIAWLRRLGAIVDVSTASAVDRDAAARLLGIRLDPDDPVGRWIIEGLEDLSLRVAAQIVGVTHGAVRAWRDRTGLTRITGRDVLAWHDERTRKERKNDG